jgi:uncharacterized protein
MATTTGRSATPKVSQYLEQLCKHFGHKVEIRFDEHWGRIAFPGAPVGGQAAPLWPAGSPFSSVA